MTPHYSIPTQRIPRQRSLASYSPWGHKESDVTETLPLKSITGIQETIQARGRVSRDSLAKMGQEKN